jgi:hypothetical protein
LVEIGVERRVLPGRFDTTVGVSELARVASCNRIAAESPAPSDGAPMTRRASSPQSGQADRSGIDAIGWRSTKSGQSAGHRYT